MTAARGPATDAAATVTLPGPDVDGFLEHGPKPVRLSTADDTEVRRASLSNPSKAAVSLHESSHGIC